MNDIRLQETVTSIFKNIGKGTVTNTSDVFFKFVKSPINLESIGAVSYDSVEKSKQAIAESVRIFNYWKQVPAPKRGELIRLYGNSLRRNLPSLATLITIETGKNINEAKGEVQEMIDICDFAVGLSRQLHGLTITSERPNHKLLETWHPNGPVLVISAFNFPAAVWAWNFVLAIVCGNPVIWKPSEKTPMTAKFCNDLFSDVASVFGNSVTCDLSLLSQIVIPKVEDIQLLLLDKRIKLVSATGSTEMGKTVAPIIAQRLGKSLLELGGNNGAIVCPSADLDLTIRSVLFSAVGTCGQRCTTLRRLFVHEDIHSTVMKKLDTAWQSLRDKIGNPLNPYKFIGPLISEEAYIKMQETLSDATRYGYKLGGYRMTPSYETTETDEKYLYSRGYYVYPALISGIHHNHDFIYQETFAPILYVMKYKNLDDAIMMHNDVDQGLSSSIFTNDIRESERFLAESDCGITNVNIGTSGAEIGGSFGGEKDTGGGRESGTDAWKNYMRRSTNTINYGSELPLAQGIKFEI